MEYKPPFFLFHPHLETIYPGVLRVVSNISYNTERIDTDDKDFLDLDWYHRGSEKLVILCHGLEGNSRRPYMKGMAKYLSSKDYDVLSWSYRGCGDEMNLMPQFYHSGASYDLDQVIRHVLELDKYKSIQLVGFSLGGNLILKYLGEEWESKKSIRSGVAISVPVDLEGCSVEIHKPHNWIYTNRFLATLRKKVKEKSEIFPDVIDKGKLKDVKTLRDFDNIFTAPVHGFTGASEYYETCSAIRFIENIEVPVLIINAVNDSFLSESCYPKEQVNKMKNLAMLMPERGGHVGFCPSSGGGIYWSEIKTYEFLNSMNQG